uniref:fibronectin type III domain containing protein 3C1-like n=1 Tax=Styela clava TaxID=7725 RepID=UPI001939AE68|nr:fibronectin type III domain containing protein 3C1-like [Styela clava]
MCENAVDKTEEEMLKLQSNGVSVPLHFDKPELNEEVDWDKSDGTCALVKWKGANMSEDEKYRIYWWTEETDKQFGETSGQEYFLSKLKKGCVYFVYVIQINDAGESAPSNTIKFETGPRIPFNIQVSNYQPSPHDSLLVQFENANFKQVEHLVIAQSITGEDKELMTKKGQNFALIQELTPGQFYSINVSSVVDELRSDQATFSEMVQTYPAKPEGVEAKMNCEDLKIEWEHLNIRPKSYKIFWEENGKRDSSETSENEFFINNPNPSTIFKFKVAAINDAGQGEKSEEAKLTTVPAAPTNIVVKPNPRAKSKSFIVTYDDPDPVLKKTYRIVANDMEGKKQQVSCLKLTLQY